MALSNPFSILSRATTSPPSNAPLLPLRRPQCKIEVQDARSVLARQSSMLRESAEDIAPRRPAAAIPLPKPKAMTLQELACTYSNQLPLSVTAQRGYYGMNNAMEISVGETFFIHKVKTTDVLVAASQCIEKYNIPLYSSCRLSLLYNPHEDMSEALKGYVFNGVMKLASADPLPKVVCTLTAWENSNTAIKVKEILVVRGINSNKELEVFSVTSSQTKLLPFNCQSKFTTDPRLLYMYLLDMVDNIPGAFPCQALLQDTDNMINVFGSQQLILLKRASEPTLLCSYPGTNDPFELPVDLPEVMVSIYQKDELELHESTKDIFSDFYLAQIACPDDVITNIYESIEDIFSECNPAYIPCCQDDETQSEIYASVRREYEIKGFNHNNSQETSWQINSVHNEALQVQRGKLERTPIQESEVTHAHQQNDEDDSLEQLKWTNRCFLASLSEEMVRRLLHSMGLQKYEEAFWGITGAAMCKLTEEMLEYQLGVKSKLHRIKIMKIVNGEKDAGSFLFSSV